MSDSSCMAQTVQGRVNANKLYSYIVILRKIRNYLRIFLMYLRMTPS